MKINFKTLNECCLILLLAVIFSFGSGSRMVDDGQNWHLFTQSSNNNVSPCPVEVEDNENYIKSFLTSAEWAKGRQETNTEHLTMSQVTVLTSPQFNTTCETLNNRFQEAISETYSDGSHTFDLTYYKVGNYYFVIISRRQPAKPDLVASGVEYITIFDNNLDVVKGYFF